MSGSANEFVTAVAPIVRRVRAYFAPVDRTAGVPVVFDAAQMGSFDLEAAPAPWIDLGWCSGFARTSATKIAALRTGAPAVVQMQVRTEVEATVSLLPPSRWRQALRLPRCRWAMQPARSVLATWWWWMWTMRGR